MFKAFKFYQYPETTAWLISIRVGLTHRLNWNFICFEEGENPVNPEEKP